MVWLGLLRWRLRSRYRSSKTFGDDASLNIFGGYSIRTFARVQADLALPTFASNRARITLSGSYIDAPDVRYFGVGNFSSEENETRFGYQPTAGAVRLDISASKNLTFGGGVDYQSITTAAGRTSPSIDALFSPANTPGSSDRASVTSTARHAPRSIGGGRWGTRDAADSSARNSTISTSATPICIRFNRSKGKCSSSYRFCERTG